MTTQSMFAVLIVLLLLVAAPAAHGQLGVSTITGRITDISGAVVSGAIIGAVAALGVALVLTRRKRTKAFPPPVQWPPETEAPQMPPHMIREPLRPPPPGT